MPKNARDSKNLTAFALEFLGSLIFLYLVFGTGTQLQGGGVWLPILWAAAVISAVMLFFVSLGNLTNMGNVSWGAMRLSTIAGFSTIALTVTTVGSTSGLYWIAILGFVLGLLGSFFGWRK